MASRHFADVSISLTASYAVVFVEPACLDTSKCGLSAKVKCKRVELSAIIRTQTICMSIGLLCTRSKSPFY